MNEQAINDLYNLAKQNGYTKSLDEFVNLMYTNDNAFNDMYSLAQNNGYQKSQDDFSILIGKKKSEVAPSAQPQPKEEAQPMAQQPQAATELPSEGTSSESQLPKSNVIGEPFKGFTPEQAKTAFQPESAQKAFTLSQAQKEELGYQIPQSQTDFQKSMGQVNKELMDYDEEHIVPQLNYAFSNYGFHFNETGAGDYVEAVAPNGKRITIPVDNWTEKGDIQSSNELKAFIEQNKPKIAKLTSEYENYEKKFNTQKEVDNTIKNLHTEADSLNQAQKQAAADKIEVDKQAKELESVPMNQRNTPEYISRSKELAAKRSEVDARINKISQDEKTLPIKEQKLNKAIGQYTAAKAQQGGLFRAAYNTILDEIGSATAGIEDLNVRLAANVYSKIKGIQYALETGSLAPLSAPAQEAIAAEAYGVGKEKIIPTIKAAPKEAIGAQGVTEEYLKGVNEDFIKRNVLGVAGMVPMIAGTMVAPEAAGTIAAGWFFTTTYDHSLEQMDKNPAFKDVSDAEKGGVAAALGVVNATIASKGVTHILGNSGVMSSIINNTLGKLGVETTAKTLSEAVANDIENKVAKGVITTAASAATGALTGAELKGSELLLENTYNIIKDKKMFQTPDTFSGYLDEIGQSAADMAVGGVMLSVPNIISSAYSKSNFDGVTDEKLAFFDAMASDPITRAAYAANLKNEILSGKITVEQAKNHMDNLNNSIAIYQKVPKDLTPAATRKAMGLMVERNNLQLEVDSHDAAMTKKQRERIAEINSELEKVSEMKEKPAEAPAVPAEEVKPEEVPQEIASLADDENVVMTVKTLDEVPEEFRDRAKKVEGLEVTYRKKIFGLPIGEKTTEKVGEGYRYTLTGKEAKDYAIQKSSTEEGVLRAEQPELGLPKVGEGDQEQITTEEGVKPKAAGVEEEVSRLEEAFGGEFAPVSDIEAKKADIERRRQEELNAKDPQSGKFKKNLDSNSDIIEKRRIIDEFIKNRSENLNEREWGWLESIEGWRNLRGDIQELLFEGKYDEAKAKVPPQTYEERVNAKYDAELAALGTAPTAPTTTNGVSVSNKEQVAALDTKTTDVKKKGIIRAAATAIKTLKSIFPDMDIVIHDTKGSYEAQMDKLNGRKGSAGNFSVFRDAESGKIVGGRVDINLERANMRTVAHEVAHAVMLKAFGDNPALFGVFRDRISKMLSEERNKELNDFADQYSKSESPEEFLVELSAALTEAQEQLSPTTVQRIAELINKVVSKITGGRVQPFSGTVQTKELIDFLNTMSSAIGKGEEIDAEKINNIGVSGKIEVGDAVKSKSSIVSGEIKRFDINKNTKVEEDVKLSRFNGKVLNLMESDRMTAGYIPNEKGDAAYSFFGGVLFPAVTGKWWASLKIRTAKKIAENANKNRDADGYIYSAPMVGKKSQHMSNNDMLLATIGLMKNDVKGVKGGVKKDDFILQLNKAFSRKSLLSKANVLKSILKNNTKTSDIFNALEFILTDTRNKTIIGVDGKEILGEDGKPMSSLTFKQRLDIVSTLLGNKKVKEHLFPSAGSIEDVAKRFEEPLTSKATKVGDLVVLMRTKGTLKYKQTEKSDEFYHKSYPAEIYAVDENGNPAEIEFFVLDGAYSMRDVLPKLVKSSGDAFTWDEYFKRHGKKSDVYAEAQYNRTAKLSSASGEIVSKAQVASEVKEMGETFTVSKSQVDAWHGSPHDFDKFTTEKIGTGEGLQAFGWGLYFTDLKNIAETYADKLTKTKVSVDGEIISESKDLAMFKAAYDIANLGYKRALERNIELQKEGYWGNDVAGKKMSQEIIDNIISFENKKVEFIKDKKVYQVSLHQGKTPDQYTWLEWNKPVSKNLFDKIAKQLEIDDKTRKKFERIGTFDEFSARWKDSENRYTTYKDYKNGEVYEKLAKVFGAKDASLLLLRAGIDGVKYPAESIARGATSDTARGFNYVVFDENAVTIVSKAQKAANEIQKVIKDARAQGYSEEAIKAFLEKKGITDVDKLMEMPEAGKKVELGEELMKGYDKMMADVDAIIERGLNRNAKQETILANVLKKVRESDAYKNGTDIQREQIEREVKQAFGEKMKTAPSVGKILGTIKDVTKITMSEKNLLKNQIKDLARGAKDAKKAIETATKTITESMAKLVKRGSISSAQQKTIIKRFGDLKVLSEKSVKRFVDYMTKVFADAEYDDKLKDAYTTKKNISKLSKNTEKNAHLRDLAKRFSEIDPSMVDNIDVYNALASNIKDAVKGSTFRGEKLNEAQTVSIKRANEYIKDALEKQNKKLYEEKLAEVQEMMGVDASDLSYEQLSELIRSGKPITKYNESILRTAINKMFDVYSTVVNDMFDKSKDPFTGEDITIDANKKDLVKRFMDMDLNKLEPRQALDAVDSLTNFIQNGSTAKMETVVAEYTANENMAELERRNVKGIQLKAYKSGQVGRLFGEYLMSLPLLMERVFRDYKTSSLVQKMSGLTEVINKKAKAVAKANAITNEYISKFYKEKANGEDFNTAYNATERGLAAFMTRNVIGDAKEQQVEFDVRKKFIEESIDALSKGTDKEKEKGELYQEAYDKVLKDSNNADDVRSKTDAKNLEAVDYWVSKWAEIYDQLSDVSENVYNTLLEKHVNYSPDRYTFFERVKDKTELGDNDSAFHFNLNSLYKQKTGVLREVRRKEEGDTLPRQEGKKKPSMYVDLSFDVNNVNSMHDALVDIETAAGVRQVQEFINNESFEDIIGNAEDANLLKKRIQLFVRNMRGKSIVDADSLTKFSKRLETMASIGVGQALGGVTQPFKQTIPVAINTLINSGGIGLKVIANKSINDFIDNSGYGIANRGFGSTTELSSINNLIDLASKSKGEKAMQLIEEANKKWLKFFLVNFDVGIARASWISYYEKSLREQGIDTKDIDYSRHELNKEAADYAQRMVDRQQNISDHDLAGKLFVTKDGMSKIVSKVAMPFASFRINQFMRMTTDLGVLMNGAASKEDRFNAARSLGGFSAEMAAFKMISAGSLILMGTLTKAVMGKDEDDDEYKKRVNSAIKTQATSTVTDVLSPIPIADRAVQGVMSTALEKVQDFMNIDDEKKVSIYDGSKTTLASSLGTLGIASDRLSQLIELVKLSQTGKFTDDYGNEKEISDEDKEALKGMIGLSVLSNIGLAPTEVATIVRNSIKYAKQAKKTKNSSENEADKPPYGLTMSQYKRYFPEEYEKKYGEGSLYYEKSKLKNEISEQKEDMKRKILDERYDYVPKEKSKEGFGSNEFGKKKSGKKESSKKSGFGSSKFGKGD